MESATPTADGADSGESRVRFIARLARGELGSLRVFLTIALIWVIFQAQNDRFLSAINLTNLTLQIAAIGTISVGVVLVLLLGEIDLSVGAVSGLAAGVMAVLQVKHGWSPEMAILAGLATGAIIGFFNGFMVTFFGIPSFVVTLAGLLAWQGALLAVLGRHRNDQPPAQHDHRPGRQVLLGRRRLCPRDHRHRRDPGHRIDGVTPAAEGGAGR